MNIQAFQAAAILAVIMQPGHANPVSRRAVITGGGGHGRCTIEVTVDGAAEIEVSGDRGVLTTISGQPAAWRRFQCNAPLPPKPFDFRLTRTEGSRGNVRLLQDPRSSGGRAVIHINDSKGGRGSYTFDLQWRGEPGALPTARVIRMCQESVTDRLNQDGYRYVEFERTIPVDNPGRHDWITGTATGNREFRTTRFSFSCSVDFGAGRLRSVEVHRH